MQLDGILPVDREGFHQLHPDPDLVARIPAEVGCHQPGRLQFVPNIFHGSMVLVRGIGNPALILQLYEKTVISLSRRKILALKAIAKLQKYVYIMQNTMGVRGKEGASGKKLKRMTL